MTTSADVPYKLPIGINGRAYLIDASKYQRATLPITRGVNDNSNEPGEQTLTAEGFWRRSQENWIDGEGQEFFDSLPLPLSNSGRIRTRVWKSKGVDMFSHEGRVTLLKTTERKLSTVNIHAIMAVGARIYCVDNNAVKFTDDPTPSSPTWQTVVLTGTTADTSLPVLATDGTTVFMGCANGTVRTAVPGSTTSAALTTAPLATNISLVRYCNGRLVIGCGPSLYEQNRDGTTTLIGTNRNASFIWTDAIGAPGAIYACGFAGDCGEVYSMGLTAVGAIDIPVSAATLPRGEVPFSLLSYGGLVAIGTTVGVRIAELSHSDTALHYGPAVDFYGGPVYGMDAYGKLLFAGIPSQSRVANNYTDITSESVSSSGMAALNLARFTETLVPAYALGLQSTDAVSGFCYSVAITANGKRYFSVSGDGIWGETSAYVADGYIDVGTIRFGTIEPKVLTAVDWRHDNITSTFGTVKMVVRSVENATQYAATATNSGYGTTPQKLGNPALGELARAVVAMTAATPFASTPTLRRWGMKVLIAPQRMDEIVLPIIMKSRVPTLNETVATYNTRDEFNALKALELAGTVVDFQEGDTTLSVKVDRVQLQPERITGSAADTTHFEGMLIVRLLTVPA